MTEARPGPAASSSLWEREAEIADVVDAVKALRADASSSGSLLVFSGEAGIGKTALLAEARRIAEAHGCTVWSARGGETVTSVPFNVIRQLLQPAIVSLMPEEAREYLGDWYDIAGPALGIAEPGDRQADPQGVCDGLVAAARRLAKREWPLVLILDDAHWADQETLQWLVAFAERLDDLPVLVVVARRPGDVSGERARQLEAVAAAARPIRTLSALTPDATAGLTRATLGEHADAPFCREVWAVTGGNPYETVELLAKVQDSELEPVEASAAELRALNRSARGRGLVARLEGLGIDATRFAWAAAILGTGISLDLAAQLAGMQRATRPRAAPNCSARPASSPRPNPRAANWPTVTWSSYTPSSPAPSTARSPTRCAPRCTARPPGRSPNRAAEPLPPHATSSKCTRTTTPNSSSRCARPPANTSPSARPTRPGAVWSAPWRNPRFRRSRRACSTNWAAPPS